MAGLLTVISTRPESGARAAASMAVEATINEARKRRYRAFSIFISIALQL